MTDVQINKMLNELFNLRNQANSIKEKEAALQEEINAYAEAHISDFTEGALALKNGVIKIANNPPKLVHEGSEKALTTKEREELTELLGEEYVKNTPNLTKMVARLNGDKVLKKQLTSKHIAIVQSTRFAVKAY